MDEREIKVGLSTLVKLNKQINANTVAIAELNKRNEESDIGTVMTLGNGNQQKHKDKTKKKTSPKKK